MEITQMIELYQSGLSAPQIAAQAGLHRETVYRKLKNAGVTLRSTLESSQARVRQSDQSGVDVSQLIDLYNQGLSAQQIADHSGLTKAAVLWRIKASGITTRGHADAAMARFVRYSPEQQVEIVKLYNEGKSVVYLGNTFSCTPGTIQRIILAAGVTLRSGQESAVLQGHTKNIPDREQIPDMYRAGMSINTIAQKVGLTAGAVHSILDIRKSEFRDPIESRRLTHQLRYEERQQEREAAKALLPHPEPPVLTGFRVFLADKEWLQREYALKSDAQIAEEIGCTDGAVHYARKQFGITGSTTALHRDRTREANIGTHRNLGSKRTPEQRARMSAAAMGKPGTNLGRKFTDEHKQKLRQSNFGKKHNVSPEGKARHRAARAAQVLPMQDTSIEIALQAELTRRGIPFRTHVELPGQPDIFIEPNICVFADGDYWHSFQNRKDNDARINKTLTEQGYHVVRFSETVIKKCAAACVDAILKGDSPDNEK